MCDIVGVSPQGHRLVSVTSSANSEHKHSKIERFSALKERIINLITQSTPSSKLTYQSL